MTNKKDERHAAAGDKDGTKSEGKEVQLDEALYSRQLYVMGHEASRRMAAASVLLCGLGGLGVEIAKDIILMGVKSVTLYDTKKVTLNDLSTQFYLREEEEGKGRADACVGRLQELNPNVKVEVASVPLSLHLVAKHEVVVLTDSPLEEQLRVSRWCREAGGTALVVAAARGLCGQVFCDFGESFKVLEPKARELARFPVANVTNEEEGLVTLPPKTFHGLQDRDVVVFSNVKGMAQLNASYPHVVKVESGTSFRVGDTRDMGLYQGGGECQELRRPLNITFKPLPEALDHASIIAADCMKEQKALVLHVAFLALHEYEERQGCLPRPWHVGDANKFMEIFRDVNKQRARKAEEDGHVEELVRTFAYTAGGQTAPLISVVGGVAAQEVAKACSAKFPPLQQWLYFDALECLPQDTSQLLKEEAAAVPADRYSAQVALFGPSFQERLGDLQYFIVGAGAIGCELLKNLALAGVGAGKRGTGELIVTDMDVIEKSNLSRQFLFRPRDVTRPKSETAAAAARAINPALRVTAHQLRVAADTEHVFNASFYESLNGVALALDNVEARRYMDHACWLHRRPMLESGTLGPNGSVQPVLAGLTERYAQEQVAEDRPVAVCTLRRFPTTIQHTLQWARDVFEGEFVAVPQAAVRYLSGDGGPPDADIRVRLRQALTEVPQSFKDCVVWARRLWQVLYHDAILDLLDEFPPDKVTSSGAPFWSDGKRRPQPLNFQPSDRFHLDFIHAAANLHAAVYGLQQVRTEDRTQELVQGLDVPARSPRKPTLGGGGTEQERKEEQDTSDLPDPASLQHLHLSPLTFEKDDDDNFHVDFITAASNLRATNYGIAPVDRATSKRIAGRIIPAIVTSTAVAAGLAVLELLKVAQGHTHLEAYRTTEFNLALCRFCMAEPAPTDDLAEDGKLLNDGKQLEVEGELTMAQFLAFFHDVHQLEVILVAVGNLTLDSFLLPKAERARRSGMMISAIVEEVGGEAWSKAGPVLMLELGAEDLDGEEVEVPPVRYIIRKEKKPDLTTPTEE